MSNLLPLPPDPFTPRDVGRARWFCAARDWLRDQGAQLAPEISPADVGLVRALDALLAQSARAARHATGTIRAYASLMEDAYAEDPDAIHWLDRIQQSTEDLDDFAGRLGTLRVCDEEEPRVLAWNELLGCAAERCGAIAGCAIEIADRTRGSLRVRAELLGRILFHILRNAVEATPRGGMVRVRVDEVRIGGMRSFHVRVSDRGSGIARDRARDIWQPFVSDKPGHTGLGLTYVSSCAPMVGACVGMRSDGGGTTFHLALTEEGAIEW